MATSSSFLGVKCKVHVETDCAKYDQSGFPFTGFSIDITQYLVEKKTIIALKGTATYQKRSSVYPNGSFDSLPERIEELTKRTLLDKKGDIHAAAKDLTSFLFQSRCPEEIIEINYN